MVPGSYIAARYIAPVRSGAFGCVGGLFPAGRPDGSSRRPARGVGVRRAGGRRTASGRPALGENEGYGFGVTGCDLDEADARIHAEALRNYAEKARSLVPGAVRALVAELEPRLSPKFAAPPSPAEIVGTKLGKEPYWSFLFAWLLDPIRSGIIAERFWPALHGLLVSEAGKHGAGGHLEGTEQEASRRACLASLRAWQTPDGSRLKSLAGLDVMPHKRNVEAEFLDVDAWSEAQQFGLVVEIKTNKQTQERKLQLDDYFGRRKDRADSTTFVFLTESGREPTSAPDSKRRWQRLGWAQIALVLAGLFEGSDCADDAGQAGEAEQRGARILTRQIAHLIRHEILGQRTVFEDRAKFAELRQSLGPDPTEDTLLSVHRELCRLRRNVR